MALRLTGSIDFLTGAITTDQHGIYSGSFSGSGHITSASYASNSDVSTSTLTASYIEGANVDGEVLSASYASNSDVSTSTLTASYIEGANVDGTVTSASYALTASHALNGGGGGGTTINPTDNVIPVRSDATTFIDSPITAQESGQITGGTQLTIDTTNFVLFAVNPTGNPVTMEFQNPQNVPLGASILWDVTTELNSGNGTVIPIGLYYGTVTNTAALDIDVNFTNNSGWTTGGTGIPAPASYSGIVGMGSTLSTGLTTIGSDLTVTGSAKITGSAEITGSTEIIGSFGVTGSARIKNEVTTGGGSFQTGLWTNPSTMNSFPSGPLGLPFAQLFSARGCEVNKTFVVSGRNSNFNPDVNTYTYDGTWNLRSNSPMTIDNSVSTAGDACDAILGFDEQNFTNPQNYDGYNDTWSTLSFPPDSCCSRPGFVGNCNSGALQFGGCSNNMAMISNETYCFSGGIWNQCSNMPANLNSLIYAGNPLDALALGGGCSMSFPSMGLYNYNGMQWSTEDPFFFTRLENQSGDGLCLTGNTSTTALFSTYGFNARYDGVSWELNSGTVLEQFTDYSTMGMTTFYTTGDQNGALGITMGLMNSQTSVEDFGQMSEYSYGTPSPLPSSIWYTPSSPTLNSHSSGPISGIRTEAALAGCSDAALIYGGMDDTGNVLSSADFYNGTTWSQTTNGPTIIQRMLAGGSANESWWVGGQGASQQYCHFEYNSGIWNICGLTPFSNPTEQDMGAGSQSNFKVVGCNGHYKWTGISWNADITSPSFACSPSGFGTQNDFLQVGGTSNFNATSDVYKFDGVSWILQNGTPYVTSCGGGAGSTSDGIIYNYNQPFITSNNLYEYGYQTLAFNGNTWSAEAFAPTYSGQQRGYTMNSNSALTPDTAIMYGAGNDSMGNSFPRCSAYFSRYNNNIGGGGTTSICDVAKFEDGMVVLPLIQSTFDFVDDAAAATGGVPLGGLYRNGSDIKIRLT